MRAVDDFDDDEIENWWAHRERGDEPDELRPAELDLVIASCVNCGNRVSATADSCPFCGTCFTCD